MSPYTMIDIDKPFDLNIARKVFFEFSKNKKYKVTNLL